MNILDLKINKKRWLLRLKELEGFLGRKIPNFEEELKRAFQPDELKEGNLYDTSDHILISSYYSQTSKYIFELLRWEATYDKLDNYRRLYLFVKKFKLKGCLDFGAGIGGLCIYLAQRGIACDYADIQGRTLEFAKFRFSARNLALDIFDTLTAWPDKKYDAVFAYDVLEHIPGLANTTGRISGLLNKGGYFVAKPTFSGRGLHLKENERYLDMREFNKMMRGNGLIHMGRLKNSFVSEALRLLGVNLITGIRVKNDAKYGGDFLVYKKDE